ncbi:MAG: hypothetical protein ACXWUG_29780 [Polyangiales bacterium]
MTMTLRSLLLIAAVVSLGCWTTHSPSFVATGGRAPHAPIPHTTAKLYEGKPECEFDQVGMLDAGHGAMATDGEELAYMRDWAADKGYDGIYDAHCGALGTVGQGQCSARVFLCK